METRCSRELSSARKNPPRRFATREPSRFHSRLRKQIAREMPPLGQDWDVYFLRNSGIPPAVRMHRLEGSSRNPPTRLSKPPQLRRPVRRIVLEPRTAEDLRSVDNHHSETRADTPRLVILARRPSQRMARTVADGISCRCRTKLLALVEKQQRQTGSVRISRTRNSSQLGGLRPRSRAKNDIKILTAHTPILHGFNRHARPDIESLRKSTRETAIALCMKKTLLAGQLPTSLIHNSRLDFQQIHAAGQANLPLKIRVPHGEILRAVVHRMPLPALRRTPPAQATRLVKNHHPKSRSSEQTRRTNPSHPSPDHSHRLLFHNQKPTGSCSLCAEFVRLHIRNP